MKLLEGASEWAMTKKQYRTPNVSVGTVKKSIAAMASRWFLRNVSHRFTGSGSDFYMVYYSPVDHSEIKRDLYTANFVFVFKAKVSNELIPINPLGVAITYFREDQAFK
jgi:hypothetical protein